MHPIRPNKEMGSSHAAVAAAAAAACRIKAGRVVIPRAGEKAVCSLQSFQDQCLHVWIKTLHFHLR